MRALLGIAVVIGVVGYRFFRSEGSTVAPAETVALLPKGAKIVSIVPAGDRIVVTIDVVGATEIRTVSPELPGKPVNIASNRFGTR